MSIDRNPTGNQKNAGPAQKSPVKRNTIMRILSVVVVFLGILSYLLADRYLIEHVEISNVIAATGITAQPPAASTQAVQATAVSSVAAQPTAASTQAAQASLTSGVTADQWNYRSDQVSIAIKKVTTGSGKTTVTYFVADVVVADATDLQSAFAKNAFGRNIIQYTSVIARANNAIFAINGDYYGFRSDGIIIRNGVIYRDVPVRTGLAFYKDGTMKIYDETQTTAQKLLEAGVWNTLSFGPGILVNSQIPAGITAVEIDHNPGAFTIQGDQPRTGLGIIAPNHFVFVVADGRSTGYSMGVDMTEFAQIFKGLGCTDAYNIDGGGSTTLYFMGRVVNNPLGKNQERGTSDILFIGAQ
jgi:exopolysaccharide biosynthesis protein